MKKLILAGLTAASALAAVAPAAQAQPYGYGRRWHPPGFYGPHYVVSPPVYYNRPYYGPPAVYGPRFFHRYHCWWRRGYRICRR